MTINVFDTKALDVYEEVEIFNKRDECFALKVYKNGETRIEKAANIQHTKDSYGFYITCDYEVLYTFPGKRAKINRKLIKQATSLSDKFNGFDCSSLAEEASDHLCNRYHL
jgi:hypothetical protein